MEGATNGGAADPSDDSTADDDPLLALGQLFFVGLDANLLFVPSDYGAHPVVTMHGQLGVTF
jgi:hypothetical protein